jgi:hypothetical protein
MSTDGLTTLLLTLILAVPLAFFVKPFIGTPPVSAGSSTLFDQLVALGGISPELTAEALLNPRTGDVWLLGSHPATLKPILEWRGRIEELAARAR